MKKLLLLATTLVVAAAMASAQTFQLTGAGATFPQPLYIKMFDEYKTATGNEVNYQGVGSGAGIAQLTAKTVDFGASDAPMNADEISKAGADVIHIPTCVGAIVVTFNLPHVSKLRMTGPVLADIYLGKVTTWDDPEITAINPGLKLSGKNIVIVRRADSSGTSYNFTGYLTKESSDWASQIGQSKNPKWPVGLGGKGNPGVAAYVKQIPYSIGYVEIAYALQNKMPSSAIMQNKAGNWMDPADISTVGAAADIDFPADAKADLIDSTAKKGYPISTTTWLLVYKDQTYTGNQAKSQAVMKTIWWMLHEGQKYNEAQGYAKLPIAAVKVAETLMKSVTYNGQPLLQ